MMQIGDAIYPVLTSDAWVQSIVGTKVYPALAAQEIEPPYVVYDVDAHIPHGTMDGRSKLDQVIVSFDCVCATYTQAVTLAQSLRECLDRLTAGTYGGVQVRSCFFEDMQPVYESDDRMYIATATYRFNVITEYIGP